MAKQPKGELVVLGFDYSPLEAQVAKQVRSAAERIREKVKKTVEDIIEVGNDLLAVKEALPHGQFGPWLKCEFGWGERMAQNFMAVAQTFGPKTEIIADLTIQPTAAYLLAAPSASDEAREDAIKRAEAGEKVTTEVAKEILADTRRITGNCIENLSAQLLPANEAVKALVEQSVSSIENSKWRRLVSSIEGIFIGMSFKCVKEAF
jgi:gas vesicle protein